MVMISALLLVFASVTEAITHNGLSKLEHQKSHDSTTAIVEKDPLQTERLMGRWFQVLTSSLAVETYDNDAYCVVMDFIQMINDEPPLDSEPKDTKEMSVMPGPGMFSFDYYKAVGSPDGEVFESGGYAIFSPAGRAIFTYWNEVVADLPGTWVVQAVGDSTSNDTDAAISQLYSWVVLTDIIGRNTAVLAKNPETFNALHRDKVLQICYDEGWFDPFQTGGLLPRDDDSREEIESSYEVRDPLLFKAAKKKAKIWQGGQAIGKGKDNRRGEMSTIRGDAVQRDAVQEPVIPIPSNYPIPIIQSAGCVYPPPWGAPAQADTTIVDPYYEDGMPEDAVKEDNEKFFTFPNTPDFAGMVADTYYDGDSSPVTNDDVDGEGFFQGSSNVGVGQRMLPKASPTLPSSGPYYYDSDSDTDERGGRGKGVTGGNSKSTSEAHTNLHSKSLEEMAGEFSTVDQYYYQSDRAETENNFFPAPSGSTEAAAPIKIITAATTTFDATPYRTVTTDATTSNVTEDTPPDATFTAPMERVDSSAYYYDSNEVHSSFKGLPAKAATDQYYYTMEESRSGSNDDESFFNPATTTDTSTRTTTTSTTTSTTSETTVNINQPNPPVDTSTTTTFTSTQRSHQAPRTYTISENALSHVLTSNLEPATITSDPHHAYDLINKVEADMREEMEYKRMEREITQRETETEAWTPVLMDWAERERELEGKQPLGDGWVPTGPLSYTHSTGSG